MTRKDYVRVAEIVRVAKALYTKETGAAFETVHFFQTELADLFARDNPSFDRERFLKACESKHEHKACCHYSA